jgi:shikimate kinase
MAAAPLPRPIALVGMPGAGKTSVGRIAARRLGLAFFDTDEMVEAEGERTIEQLFVAEGEAAFRERERRLVSRLIGQPRAVIATGGGAMAQAATRQLLLSDTLTVWLRASPETLARRLAAAPPRPLLAGPDLTDRLRRMLASREEAYDRSDASLVTDGLTAAQAADALADLLSRARAR